LPEGGIVKKIDPFFDYYQRELNYLRYSGAQFAQKHPKIARRLDFTGAESADPHVERLLESFAYLTARLQRDIDDQFPRFSEALLSVLYPQFINPIPSFTVARFMPESRGARATTDTVIAKDTVLFTRTNDGTVCRFKTVYPVNLPPIQIENIEVVSAQIINDMQTSNLPLQLLRIRLQSLAGTFADLKLDKLRLYIAGNRFVKPMLLQSLLTAQAPCVVQATTPDAERRVMPLTLRQVGFGDNENVLPYASQVHQGYRLLFEYFHYPEKFFFIDVESAGFAIDATEMDIYLPLSPNLHLNPKDVSNHNVLLGCTPIVNLFSKITEPLTLNYQNHEYRLVADQRQESSTEIHSIQEVFAAVDGQDKTEKYMPYFSYDHHQSRSQQQAFWSMRRTDTKGAPFSGTDVFISFVDFNFNPTEPPRQTVYARVLCTNRNLATHIPPGSPFHTEEAQPLQQIICLDRPRAQAYPSATGREQWRLISHLSLSHLALTGERCAVEALKEIIQLYASTYEQGLMPEIDALQNVEIQKVTRRLREEAWRGFVQGTKITLTFDTSQANEGNIFVLCSILNRFFALMASVNTFTQLEVRRNLQEGVWLTWSPVNGNKVLV
jgi:type VI secretion system protein ImpG